MSIGDADADAAEQLVFKFQSLKSTRGIFNRIVFLLGKGAWTGALVPGPD